MKGSIYLCEARGLRLCRNGFKFFGTHLHPKYDPTQDLRFFWSLFLLLYFSSCGEKQTMVDYRLKTIEFCSDLHKYLSPRAWETMWQSLAPLQLFSGVDTVQRRITWWSCAEIQLNRKKYQTNSEKSQTWRLLHIGHLQAWEKVWDQYNTWTS
jgi:hypothetical protein